MAKPIKLLKESEIELWESVDFYETQVSGLGLDFEAEIRNALIIIRQNMLEKACKGLISVSFLLSLGEVFIIN
ncbi:MAG: hypothetical protein MI748_03165 [Opitutales bacterium]|nr:hypothetical protein [Opitutales bacterium]